MFEWIGWVATAITASSYFCKQPAALRRLQAFSALIWIGYGLLLEAAPIVVANVAVAMSAVYTLRRQRGKSGRINPEPGEEGAYN
jgi:Bacterial inner membrane protein